MREGWWIWLAHVLLGAFLCWVTGCTRRQSPISEGRLPHYVPEWFSLRVLLPLDGFVYPSLGLLFGIGLSLLSSFLHSRRWRCYREVDSSSRASGPCFGRIRSAAGNVRSEQRDCKQRNGSGL